MAKNLRDLLDRQDQEMVKRAEARADAILLDLKLAELREKAQKTQVEMAEKLGIKQPTVAIIEKKGRDIKISSLKRYIEALGGKLSVDVEFPDGTHFGITI